MRPCRIRPVTITSTTLSKVFTCAYAAALSLNSPSLSSTLLYLPFQAALRQRLGHTLQPSASTMHRILPASARLFVHVSPLTSWPKTFQLAPFPRHHPSHLKTTCPYWLTALTYLPTTLPLLACFGCVNRRG